jgi:hypothetical protein
LATTRPSRPSCPSCLNGRPPPPIARFASIARQSGRNVHPKASRDANDGRDGDGAATLQGRSDEPHLPDGSPPRCGRGRPHPGARPGQRSVPPIVRRTRSDRRVLPRPSRPSCTSRRNCRPPPIARFASIARQSGRCVHPKASHDANDGRDRSQARAGVQRLAPGAGLEISGQRPATTSIVGPVTDPGTRGWPGRRNR